MNFTVISYEQCSCTSWPTPWRSPRSAASPGPPNGSTWPSPHCPARSGCRARTGGDPLQPRARTGAGDPHARRHASCPSCSGCWPTSRPPVPRPAPCRAWPEAASPSAPRPVSSPAPRPRLGGVPRQPSRDRPVGGRGRFTGDWCPRSRSGEVDLALVVLPVTDPLVVTTPLFDDPLVLATAPDHPFATRRRVRVSDLDGLDLVMFREGYDLRTATLGGVCERGGGAASRLRGGRDGRRAVLRRRWPRRCRDPAIALPADGSLRAIPFTAPTLGRTVALGPARRPCSGPPGAAGPGRPAPGSAHSCNPEGRVGVVPGVPTAPPPHRPPPHPRFRWTFQKLSTRL